MSEQIIEKYSDADALVTAVGDRLVAAINGAIEARGVEISPKNLKLSDNQL